MVDYESSSRDDKPRKSHLSAQDLGVLEKIRGVLSQEIYKTNHIGVKAFMGFLQQRGLFGEQLKRTIEALYHHLMEYHELQTRANEEKNQEKKKALLQKAEKRKVYIEKIAQDLQNRFNIGAKLLETLTKKILLFYRDHRSLKTAIDVFSGDIKTRRNTNELYEVWNSMDELQSAAEKILQNLLWISQRVSKQFQAIYEALEKNILPEVKLALGATRKISLQTSMAHLWQVHHQMARLVNNMGAEARLLSKEKEADNMLLDLIIRLLNVMPREKKSVTIQEIRKSMAA